MDWERAGDDPEFHLIQVVGSNGTFFNGQNDFPVVRSDVEQLGARSYLHIRYTPRGGLIASLTADAHSYYEAHQGAHHPAEQLAEQIRTYVDTRAMSFYPEADAHLREAARRLWAARRDADVKDVGDKCRDAIQSFASAFYQRFYPRSTDEPIPTEKTADHVSKVIRYMQQERGDTDTRFADALFEYWRSLIDLDQKVVHSSQQTERPLRWQDGSRIVLHAYLLIGDLHAYCQWSVRRAQWRP